MELLKGSGQNQPESAGSSSTLSGGLRFGQKIYFEDGSGAGLSKNRVNAGRKSMTARCQVEGCRMDLSNAKTYYSRHKVCCIHSKSSKVIVSGLHQRFCQQCSRFHQLSEFDLEKRSCRRRLTCHNERRRKPQATTASLYGSVLGDPTTWSTARDSHQLMNAFLSQGSSSFSITYPEIVNNNSSRESSCALSLLSNPNTTQQLKQLQTSVSDSLRVTMAQSPPVSTVHSQYTNQTWGFMSGKKSNSPCVSPVLGLSQISEPDELRFLMSNGTTMGGFELNLQQQVLRQYLEPDDSRAYDSSTQHFTWPL